MTNSTTTDSPKPREDGMPTSADERYLRRVLARYAGIPMMYWDDGEAQGQQRGVTIDFMRESVADIDAKLMTLALARWSTQMQTNGKTRPPDINDMLNALERFKAYCANPPQDFRLHPDDYEELRRQALPYLRSERMPDVPDSFSGVRIVVDSTAERLPRKAPSNVEVSGPQTDCQGHR